MINAIALAQDLIRRPSVTPRDEGALDVLCAALAPLGFTLQRMKFGETDNLFARLGDGAPHFCFAGHTDVVPPGAEEDWRLPPFSGALENGWLHGRGAADMKAAIAAMAAGVELFLRDAQGWRGSISFLITGDEEGPGHDGTVRVLRELSAAGVTFDHCLVGEPTSEEKIGDVIKNGRRGSLNAVIEAEGRQGHVAYPDLAANPVGAMIDLLSRLKARRLDEGAPGFLPSQLEVTSVDVGNPTHNVIPQRATARLNIRFNTAHGDGETLKAWIEEEARACSARFGVAFKVTATVTGRPFLTAPSAFTELVCAAARETLHADGRLSTSGGTSDARFIQAYCPVVELGLQNATAHMVDERVRAADVEALAVCYGAILSRYFA